MAISFDRLRGAVARLRGTADVSSTINDASALAVPKSELEAIGTMAAKSCTWLCRKFIIENMASAGLKSENLTAAVNKAVAHLSSSSGAVRLAMPREEKGWRHTVTRKGGKKYTYQDTRKEGPYVMQAALDAGAVYGLGAKAARAKRSIKSGLFGKKTTRAVKQTHMVEGEWKTFERKAIDLGSVTVRPGMNFWRFSAAQVAEINKLFRKNFFGLVKKHYPNATT